MAFLCALFDCNIINILKVKSVGLEQTRDYVFQLYHNRGMKWQM